MLGDFNSDPSAFGGSYANALAMFDANGDGFLDFGELRTVCASRTRLLR